MSESSNDSTLICILRPNSVTV